ncbi:MAG: WG repeat-containing protein [Desulfuromonadales bacterium]|nr:WG repeat-containing protein [Desulfuromonadales bacterium]
MKSMIVLILLCIASIAYGDNSQKSRQLFPVEVDGKYGYIDKAGQIVIAPKFDYASDFIEGLAEIRIGSPESGLFGYIDIGGKIVIKPKYQSAGTFSDGVAIVRDNKGLVIIDKKGKNLLRLELDMAELGFSEGLAAKALVFKDKVGVFYGFIDKTGKVIILPKYRFARNFSEGLAAVREDKGRKVGKDGYIDKNAQWIIAPQYDRATDFHDGLAAVFVGKVGEEKCGYIDKKGAWVLPATFRHCGDFSEGLASVALEGFTGFINPKGEIVIAPQFLNAKKFSGGLAEVEAPTDDEFKVLRGYINKSGKYVWGPKTYRWEP